MNANTQRYAKYIKLLLYILVVILVNLAGLTMFSRIDLTQNQVYSLSDVSKEVVATLSEPLTVKVFFTKDLPPPHNNTEQYVRDLLNEYALNNKKYFRVQFYNVSPESEGISDEAQVNRQMARDYGINPVQIQKFEKDEVKFTQAYMGLVMIHGDIIERIPTITSTDGIEYKMTTGIQKLNNKVSALLNLDGQVNVQLVLSSSIYPVAPYMNIKGMERYPEEVKEVVENLNAKSYDKLAYSYLDPAADPAAKAAIEKLDVMRINWPAIAEAGIQPGEGAIGLVMQYQSNVRIIPLLSMVRLPIIGTQYSLTEISQLEDLINTNLDRIINLNTELGYLSDFGTLPLGGLSPMMGPQAPDALRQFPALVEKTYTTKYVELKENGIPEGLKSLVIARPTEKFSDYDLYQIDQALMHGTNLAIFTDAFREIQPPQGQPMMANQPIFIPIDSGLEKLLEHYGVRIKQAMVLDENCYRQRLPQQQGGGEQPYYFVPIIKSEFMNKKLPYIKNIKGLITVKAAPLELNAEQIEAQGITANELFASSDRSWEMRGRINLNPKLMTPPASDSEMQSYPLAYLLEGSFVSYFKGKPMPEKPAAEDENKPADEKGEGTQETETETSVTEPEDANSPEITPMGAFREQSPPAKILLVGSSEVLSDNLLDNEGETTNSLFVLNTIDALNGREAVAVMHSKIQQFNPLEETGPGTKAFIKTFNMAVLPALVVVFGLLVWWRRHIRRKKIQIMFQK